MDVAFVSEFVARRRVFRQVDAGVSEAPIEVGGSDPLEESYCWRVVQRKLPELIPDTSAVPAAMAMPVTTALPVGAHLSVPIHLPDGRTYGTFCCFSFLPNRSLNERDTSVMRAFAEIIAQQIHRDIASARERREKVARIEGVLSDDQLSTVYQPIHRLKDGRCVGFECLSRFSALPPRSPDVWFAEAAEVGLVIDLELAAIKKAVGGLPALPADCYLALNVCPETIASGRLLAALNSVPTERIVLELTEHAAIEDYAAVLAALDPIRRRGVRFAVDDAGAGYASFKHILTFQPDLIKLDVSLIRGIHDDRRRYALASALVSFARVARSAVVAEGVETPAELTALRQIEADHVQGYLLGRPMPLRSAVEIGIKAP
jgi:EAL domain-containing protein (putative c-di-GMP-specific phosphodiesterase class I)